MTYSRSLVWKKNSNDRKVLAPHVYEISALAYKGLSLERQDQSILVSGESGAGKTETVKICLNHIASIQRGVEAGTEHAKAFTSPVVQRVLDSNPLLEAFGNAKTTRNDNSSRFGKYIQLQFDGEDLESAGNQGKIIPDCVLAGSLCEVYLLEKSRVVSHNSHAGERTYHIFYQLLAAPEKVKTDIWHGLSRTCNESFNYVGRTDTHAIEGQTDGERFAQTMTSLELIGVKGAAFRALFRSICAVLQLGNIAFVPHPEDSERTTIASTGEFEALSELVGIEPTAFFNAFTQRKIEARGEILTASVTSDRAKEACDALAKEIYDRAFLWLVRQINDATCAEQNYQGTKRSGFGTIGLLDIFGFESFKANGFEQLCINYANEMLQQKFTQDVFTTVMAEYQFEGILLADITYDDNTDVLDLIEGRTGLLAMLNEESIRPNGNDCTFVRKALSTNKNSPCLIAKKIFHELEFGIQHYAGPVIYTAESFVSKNTDIIPSDLKDIAKTSSNEIIAKHLDNDAMMNSDEPHVRHTAVVSTRRPTQTHNWGKSGGRQKSSNIVGVTVWTKFKTQLNLLMGKLGETQTRYIRCIKPNTIKAPLVMEHMPTVEQLRCAGVVAAVTISRSAFPNRLDHQNVLDRFRPLWPKGVERCNEGDFERRKQANVDILLANALKQLELRKGDKNVKAYVNGRTRAYFRAGALEFLETQRLKGLGLCASEIQKVVRGVLRRQEYKRQRAAALKIKAHMRRFVEQRRFAYMRQQAISIQCWYRCVVAKQQVVKMRIFDSATKIQVQWRIHKDFTNLKKNMNAAVVIQRLARGMIQRPKYRRALQNKRDESNMALQLEKMQKQMAEDENRQKKELERERELARKNVEEERQKLFEEERRKMEQELRELRMEKELLHLKNEAARLEAEAAVTRPSTPPIEFETIDPQPASPQSVFEPEVRFVEVVKYVEVEQKHDGPVMTEEQQSLMEESGKIIEFLRNENLKLKKKSEQQRKDFATLKENNLRLMEANTSAGSSFQSLNQHAKQLNGTNQKLLKSVAQYRNKITQLHADMKNRQIYYREIADAYKTETDVRSFYETTMLEIVDIVSVKHCDPAIYKLIMAKAVECAKMSQKVVGDIQRPSDDIEM